MNIIKHRYWWFALSLIIIIPGLVSLFTQGLKQGIDFTGGSVLELKYETKVNTNSVRDVLNKFKIGSDAVIQITGKSDGAVIRTKDISQDTRNKVIQAMNEKFGSTKVLSEDRVEPLMGKELLYKAILALIITSVITLIYLGFRFSDHWFGIAAIIAVLHDAFIVMGLFSIFQWEVDSSFVAAVLTIIGYSIMDTIVIFDRVRENLRKKKKEESFEEVVNNSILQTIVRSLNTVLTVVFMLLALVFFGGGTTVVFIRAILIGIISGCYSSIFNASPLWVEFKNWEQRRKLRAKQLKTA